MILKEFIEQLQEIAAKNETWLNKPVIVSIAGCLEGQRFECDLNQIIVTTDIMHRVIVLNSYQE